MLERKQIILIGFKGVGKSTLGARIAEKTGRQFFDTDHWIEECTGKAPRSHFLKGGMDQLRCLERAALREIVDIPNSLLATGGSTPTDPECLELLQRSSFLIHLKEEREVVRERIFRSEASPLFDPERPHRHFEELFAQRVAFFDTISNFQCKADGLWQAIDLVSGLQSRHGGSHMARR